MCPSTSKKALLASSSKKRWEYKRRVGREEIEKLSQNLGKKGMENPFKKIHPVKAGSEHGVIKPRVF